MSSPTEWTWVWASSGSWWWTGKLDELQSMGHKESDKTYGLRRHTHAQFRELAKPSYNSQDSLLWLSSVQFSHTVVSDSLRPHGLQHTRPPCPSPLSEFTQTYVHWVSDAIQSSILHRLLLLPPSIFPSIRVFLNESAVCIRWPKYWSFSFNISSSNEHSGLIPLGWTGWISLQSKGLSRVFSKPQFKIPQLLWLGWDKWIDGFTDFTVTCFNKLCFKFLIISTRAIRT